MPLEPTVAEDFAATIGDAIDDLEAEPDARRAVIAAYARMEGVLGRHGLRREPSETPVEYLRRVLPASPRAPTRSLRLTGLFEEAKFSRHEIDGGMKRDAIDALGAIRDDLRVAYGVRKHLLDLDHSVRRRLARGALRRARHQPGVRNIALHVYVLVVGGLVMLGVVAAAGDLVPKRHQSEFDRALAEGGAAGTSRSTKSSG